MNIFTLGFFDKQNLGDESYKDTFRALFPQHNFTFLDHIKKNVIDNNEIVFLGGGNVLRTAYIKELQKIKDKKIYGFSVGMEEDLTFEPNLFEHVYARDEKTYNNLKKMNVSCSYLPDAAFILQGNPSEGLNWLKSKFKEEKLDLYENIIVVIINSYMLNSSLSSLSRDSITFLKFSYDLARIADETNASFVFIPFGTSMPIDDRISNSWVASKCKYWKKNLVVFDRINYRTALNIISAGNLTISSRLHSSIFSYVSGTPFIDITHHSKNELFLKSINKENYSIPFWNFDSNKMKNLIGELINQPKHTEAIPIAKKIWDEVNAISFAK
jgi:polysaccharide pyruvyl transferase WcaK-like protein